MTAVPDVIGLSLEDARERLAAVGVAVGEVVETRPTAWAERPRVEGPQAPPPARKRNGLRVAELTGTLRVIRVRGEGPVDLVVTRERYLPHPQAP